MFGKKAILLIIIGGAVGLTSLAAKKPAKKAAPAGPSAEILLEQAQQAFDNYELSEAARLLAQAKSRKTDDNTREDIEILSDRVTLSRNFLERVEQLEILDSIALDKHDFFTKYRIPASAGHLTIGSTEQDYDDPDALPGYQFLNENRDYRLWSAPDSAGYRTIYQSTRLMDGSWQEPMAISSLSEDGDAVFPFMMADGMTLYYASNGPESIGGYDIMVATRDGADGDFLQPQNIGMPYNSPFDDYMMAIDELNGVGWWATDRNQLDDKLTVYLFKVNDLRKNYDPDDTPDLTDRALIRSWRATQNPNEDYATLLDTVMAIDPESGALEEVDFILPMGNGKTYTRFNDFRNSKAESLMYSYLQDKENFEELLETIESLRRSYYNTRSESDKRKLAGLESRETKERDALKKKLSEIYRLERRN